MDDPKETAEHATIVDLIRNDLSMGQIGTSGAYQNIAFKYTVACVHCM